MGRPLSMGSSSENVGKHLRDFLNKTSTIDRIGRRHTRSSKDIATV